MTYILESGPVLILPVLAYGMEKPARYLFSATVIFQMILAFLILNFPVGIFAELNAANYRSYAALSGGVDSTGNTMRAVGQFSTPIQLGAYATACLGIGIVLFKKNLLKLLASFIILLGLWGEYISFTRGLLFAAVFALILFRFPRRGWKALAAAFVITLITFWAGQNLLQMMQSDTTGAIAKHMAEATNPEDDPIHYRISGFMNSVSIVRSDPAFGTCSVQAILERGEICHFFPGWLAAIYGLPAGLAALLLLFCAIRNQFKEEDRVYLRDVFSDKFLCSLFGWSALFVLSSNFMGGRALVWMMLGFACLISSWPAAKPASTLHETQ